MDLCRDLLALGTVQGALTINMVRRRRELGETLAIDSHLIPHALGGGVKAAFDMFRQFL